MVKVTPSESPDVDSFLEELQSDSFSIKGMELTTVVLEHLKKLNLAKKTSKDKMLPRTDKFSVSQSSYDCYRKVFYEMQYPRQSANNDSIGRFTMGDIIDSIMKGALESIGGVGSVECSKDYFGGEFVIKGESDVDFDNLVVEVKSVSPFAWKYVSGGKDKVGNIIVGKPKIQHVRQLNTYMDIKGIKDGVIVYVSKDNFQLKPYPIKHSPELMMQTVGRCATVFRAINEKRVPEKVKGDECLYCNHKDLCKQQ